MEADNNTVTMTTYAVQGWSILTSGTFLRT